MINTLPEQETITNYDNVCCNDYCFLCDHCGCCEPEEHEHSCKGGCETCECDYCVNYCVEEDCDCEECECYDYSDCEYN